MDLVKILGVNAHLKMVAQSIHHSNALMVFAKNHQKIVNQQLNAHHLHHIYVVIMNVLEILLYVEFYHLVMMPFLSDALTEDAQQLKKIAQNQMFAQ